MLLSALPLSSTNPELGGVGKGMAAANLGPALPMPPLIPLLGPPRLAALPMPLPAPNGLPGPPVAAAKGFELDSC